MFLRRKIRIIEEICKRHPANGVDKGWSYYVGGMADTGGWYFQKMLRVPYKELKQFLVQLKEQENQPPPVYTEEEKRNMSTYHLLRNAEIGQEIFMSEYEREFLKNMYENIHARIIFGIDLKDINKSS